MDWQGQTPPFSSVGRLQIFIATFCVAGKFRKGGTRSHSRAKEGACLDYVTKFGIDTQEYMIPTVKSKKKNVRVRLCFCVPVSRCCVLALGFFFFLEWGGEGMDFFISSIPFQAKMWRETEFKGGLSTIFSFFKRCRVCVGQVHRSSCFHQRFMLVLFFLKYLLMNEE